MRIADHHKPGHWRPKDTAYQPTQAWPDDCYVQWGCRGVVLSAAGSYVTAFFEAFSSDNAGGFIRGEGETIQAAEADAFSRYTREVACQHRWGRQGYSNGGAICYHCKAFKVIFKEIHVFGAWRKPIDKNEVWMIEDALPLTPISDPDGSRARYRRRLALRCKVFGKEGD